MDAERLEKNGYVVYKEGDRHKTTYTREAFVFMCLGISLPFLTLFLFQECVLKKLINSG
jgi:hypothetical protein